LSLQGLTDANGEEGPDLLDVYIDVTRADPLQQYIGREAAESLRVFIETELTELERQCVARLIEGISYKDTALRLDRSAKAVDNALRRARAKFERRMRAG
jgi:DNA-directed RNA polymerase specialized sigma24 family protein